MVGVKKDTSLIILTYRLNFAVTSSSLRNHRLRHEKCADIDARLSCLEKVDVSEYWQCVHSTHRAFLQFIYVMVLLSQVTMG